MQFFLDLVQTKAFQHGSKFFERARNKILLESPLSLEAPLTARLNMATQTVAQTRIALFEYNAVTIMDTPRETLPSTQANHIENASSKVEYVDGTTYTVQTESGEFSDVRLLQSFLGEELSMHSM
jgi:hypothetical protein